MGRQMGTMRFSGSIGDLNFYYTKNNGWLVRQKSTLSAKKFKNDPAFARARENGSNFGKSSTSGKYLRHAFWDLWIGLQDSRLCSRGVSLMHKVREFDTVSDRGKFQTMIGLQHPQARALLKGFSFNDGPSAGHVLLQSFTTDLSTGTISIEGLIPKAHLDSPRVATHVGFSSGFAKINFAKGYRSSFSEEVILSLDETASDVVLAPVTAPVLADSIGVLALKIVFYQEVNGELYLLSEKDHCVIEIVGAGSLEDEADGANEANWANGADYANEANDVDGTNYANEVDYAHGANYGDGFDEVNGADSVHYSYVCKSFDYGSWTGKNDGLRSNGWDVVSYDYPGIRIEMYDIRGRT